MKSRLVHSQSSLLQDIEESSLSGIIETEEKKLTTLLIKTYDMSDWSMWQTQVVENVVEPVKKEHEMRK